MRLLLAILAGKLFCTLGALFGKGSNLPGEIAEKICPGIMRRIKFDGCVIAVTGTNGKTSTANLIAHTIASCGKTVINNAKGSNLTGGIATTMVKGANLRGHIPHDYAVLEVDERFSRIIFKSFSPDLMLVTNLFRDQPTRNGNVDVICAKLNEAIAPGVKLVLNADDPISSRLAPENERVYYGMAKTDRSTLAEDVLTNDARVCPVCHMPLLYEFYHYNHIGVYHCNSCRFKTPEMRYTAEGVSFENGTFTIDGMSIHTDYANAFNILNMTGALAVCTEAGLDLENVAAALSDYKISRDRYEQTTLCGRRAYIILSKNQNPVSFDRSISEMLSSDTEKTAVIFINNINHTQNKDTTWLYDIAFERLRGHINSIVCTGPRAYDLAVRLRFGGFDEKSILISKDMSGVKETVKNTRGDIYILTEIYDAGVIKEALS